MSEACKVKVKICGLFRECDIACVNEARPDYAGFVFYPPSHRYVTKEQMQHFRELLSTEIPAVGVFVNEQPERVAEYLRTGLLQVAQLHGGEDEAYIEKLRELAPGCEIWKAYKIRSAEDLRAAEESSADRILLDNGYGTGQSFDWNLLQEKKISRPFLLAGGLRGENIGEAIARFQPWGVDLSSGVETEKKKDPEKIRQILTQIRRM
jgi:phosphoribosylanthranilate isomerase